VKATFAVPSPASATTPAGVPGVVEGMTGFDGFDWGPTPMPFVAVTVNVYVVPFFRPATVIALAVPTAVAPPGDATTAYWLIGDQGERGAVNPTTAKPAPATAVTFVGARGSGAGVIGPVGFDGLLVPRSLVAVTVIVYGVPFFRPVTVIGL